jgi:hypothetical protein
MNPVTTAGLSKLCIAEPGLDSSFQFYPGHVIHEFLLHFLVLTSPSVVDAYTTDHCSMIIPFTGLYNFGIAFPLIHQVMQDQESHCMSYGYLQWASKSVSTEVLKHNTNSMACVPRTHATLHHTTFQCTTYNLCVPQVTHWTSTCKMPLARIASTPMAQVVLPSILTMR